MVRNSRPAPMKQSSLEVITNGAMVVILIVQGVLALISAIWHCVFQTELDGHWYLFPEKIILPEGVGWWLTFFTLYSNLMPISLYPTVEFCNAFQCYFIANDRKMFFKQKGFNNDAGFPAIARSSNLCAELGQASCDWPARLTAMPHIYTRVHLICCCGASPRAPKTCSVYLLHGFPRGIGNIGRSMCIQEDNSCWLEYTILVRQSGAPRASVVLLVVSPRHMCSVVFGVCTLGEMHHARFVTDILLLETPSEQRQTS